MATKKTAAKKSPKPAKPCKVKPFKTWAALVKAASAGKLPEDTRAVIDATGFGVYVGPDRVFAAAFADFTADRLKGIMLRVVRDG
jgi:hypothetical protein